MEFFNLALALQDAADVAPAAADPPANFSDIKNLSGMFWLVR
jgi:hypothetical protein